MHLGAYGFGSIMALWNVKQTDEFQGWFDKTVKKGKKVAYELRLKAAREILGLNQTDFKGLTQPEVSKIESRKDVKLSTLQKYAKAMGMKVKITLISEDEGKSISIYG